MDIFSLAEKFYKEASLETYQAILEVLDLAQALRVSPYEELTESEQKGAEEIAHLVEILADKAYHSGLSVSELNYLLGKIKDKVLQVSLNPENQGLVKDLGEILDKLQNFPLSEVEAQLPGSSEPQGERMERAF